MNFLFLGDIVGRAGRNAVTEKLKGLIDQYEIDFVIANGENSAGGYGTVSYTHLTLPTILLV